jgi:ATP-dependent Clp protease adaptor protein ClpS
MQPNLPPIPERIEKESWETQDAPLYDVIIHNDDVTPMDFVIDVLTTIFCVPNSNAAHIMITAHINGEAYVQTLPKPEAQRRINKARFAARLSRYPLEFSMQIA